jgi:hypothetical protein
VSSTPDLPDGFVAETRGARMLVARADCDDELRRAGLDQPEGWERRLVAPAGPSGRGPSAIVELPSAGPAHLKRLRRGGLAGPLWGDRFVGTRRVLDNVRVPVELRRREVSTPAPLALLIDGVGSRLVRAWLAVERIEAEDLRAWLVPGRPGGTEALAKAMALVRRMHERGLEHRDLNLGNLLIRTGRVPEAFVIDLDGARLHPGPLGFRACQRALRRLERSYVKACHPGPAPADVREAFYREYTAGDTRLASRLGRGRSLGRVWIGLHRLGWRR